LDGTLGLAALAGEAEVHDALHLLAVPGLRTPSRMREHVAQHVGARAGGVLLVARRHVARAHRAAHEVGLAALADAGALLRGAEHALVALKLKTGLVFRRRVVGAVAQVVSIGGVSMILPGFKTPRGSNVSFTRRIIA
jgi:hypothetical protein